MRRFVYQLVERLADPKARLSRNRQFSLLSSGPGLRALRLHRHLRSLESDLARHPDAKLTVVPHDDRIEVRVEVPSLHLVRAALLTDDDVALLAGREGPLSEALEPHLRRH